MAPPTNQENVEASIAIYNMNLMGSVWNLKLNLKPELTERKGSVAYVR